MMAAIKSKPECKASESTPRLPVLTTRKAFSETKSVAEPTLKSAARFFSRASIGATISIAELDYLRFCIFLGLQVKGAAPQMGTVIWTRSSGAEAEAGAAWLRLARHALPPLQRGARARRPKQAGPLGPLAPSQKRLGLCPRNRSPGFAYSCKQNCRCQYPRYSAGRVYS